MTSRMKEVSLVWLERKQAASRYLVKLSAALTTINVYHGQLLALLMSTIDVETREAAVILAQAQHILKEVSRMQTAVVGFLQATLETQFALVTEGYEWTEDDKEFGCETRVLADRLAAVCKAHVAVKELLQTLIGVSGSLPSGMSIRTI